MTERPRCPICDSHVCFSNSCKPPKRHETECCRLHGCLLDGKCPVEVGGVLQKGPCVLCPPVGSVGWDNGTVSLLRLLANLIDENSDAEPGSPWVKLPHLGDVMRGTKGHANPKQVVQLLHVLGGTARDQCSASMMPTGNISSGEIEMEIQIESGEQLHSGTIHLSKEFTQTLLEQFDVG
jgi:hypothetical protein